MRDLTDILQDWAYDPSACVRKIIAEDGRELLQVRTPLGIEQYELMGRPDGQRPFGCESMLEHFEGEAVERLRRSSGDFVLSPDQVEALQQEALLYYCRYVVCFQVGEYDVVLRDTTRNLRMFDFLSAHCRDADSVNASAQYRPYIMRMRAAALALQAVGRGDYASARKAIEAGLREIAGLPDVPTRVFASEKKRSLAILRGMRRAIPAARAPSQEELLRQELRDAVAAENYERAAEIRDRLRQLPTRDDSDKSTPPMRNR